MPNLHADLFKEKKNRKKRALLPAFPLLLLHLFVFRPYSTPPLSFRTSLCPLTTFDGLRVCVCWCAETLPPPFHVVRNAERERDFALIRRRRCYILFLFCSKDFWHSLCFVLAPNLPAPLLSPSSLWWKEWLRAYQ
jgi:hypothetical protein